MAMKGLKVKPLGDRVLVQELKDETEHGGIVLPEGADSDQDYLKAEVLAVGTDEKEIKVKKGDQVLLNSFSAKKLKLEDQEYLIVKSKDILALLEQ
ncbi:MAG TPA: co-chaperone GroES [Candidatus Fraserbacteria bacterium]|nr:co-chaperone GroES [Candidatus Fraserbacteria bacterium]